MDDASASTKAVWFVRHGQSEANVLFYAGKVQEARAIRDPGLSEQGVAQARGVPAKYQAVLGSALSIEPSTEQIDLLVISPMRRTIQTAMHAFGDWLATRAAAGSSVPIVLAPDIQETGDVLCDTGRPASEVRAEFEAAYPCLPFDTLPEDWCQKEGLYAHTGNALAMRFRKFTRWLQARPEQNVLVVAHHNVFLGMLGISFLNCEVRKFALQCRSADATEASIDSAAARHAAEGGDERYGGGGLSITVPPLMPPWEPVQPKISTHDDQLSKAELEFVNNPTMKHHNKAKMELWGFRMPDRLR